VKAGEMLKKGELSAETLLQRTRDAEQTASKDSFGASSENKKVWSIRTLEYPVTSID
jgi:hypothetical protein